MSKEIVEIVLWLILALGFTVVWVILSEKKKKLPDISECDEKPCLKPESFTNLDEYNRYKFEFNSMSEKIENRRLMAIKYREIGYDVAILYNIAFAVRAAMKVALVVSSLID